MKIVKDTTMIQTPAPIKNYITGSAKYIVSIGKISTPISFTYIVEGVNFNSIYRFEKGDNHVVITARHTVTNQMEVYVSGMNDKYQLGFASPETVMTPTRYPRETLGNGLALHAEGLAGNNHTIIWGVEGGTSEVPKIFSFGGNAYGQLGHGFASHSAPVMEITNIVNYNYGFIRAVGDRTFIEGTTVSLVKIQYMHSVETI